MKRLIPLLLLLAAALLAGCSESDPPPELTEATDDLFEVGQVWNYETRPGEETSALLITRIERGIIDGEEQLIIHVYVDKLQIEHPDGGQVTHLDDLPFTKIALVQSVKNLFDLVTILPETENAYNHWREAYEQGDANIFDVSVATAIDDVVRNLGR